MYKIDKEKRKSLTKSLTMLGSGLLASSLPRLAKAGGTMELIVDHVMFPVYFNNKFLDVAEEVWKEHKAGKVVVGEQNPAYKGVYLHSKSFYVEHLSNVKEQPYWSNAIYFVVPKKYWSFYQKPALVSEYFLVPEFGCGYQLVSPEFPHLNSKVSADVDYDGLVILISPALEAEIMTIAGKNWALPSNGKVRVHKDLKYVHDIVVINEKNKTIAPLLQPNPILREYL
ncbi:MAG: hypothetical protein ACRBHB_01060 [Arenicella sp.]